MWSPAGQEFALCFRFLLMQTTMIGSRGLVQAPSYNMRVDLVTNIKEVPNCSMEHVKVNTGFVPKNKHETNRLLGRWERIKTWS